MVILTKSSSTMEDLENLQQPISNVSAQNTVPSTDPQNTMSEPIQTASTPLDDHQVEEQPVNNHHVEEQPIEELPIEELPVEEQPVEEQPVERTPDEEHLSESAPLNSNQEPDTDYSGFSREQLVDELNALLDQEVQLIKNRVAKIRVSFNTLSLQAQQQHFQEFLDNGGAKEDYQNPDDPIADAFRKAYNTFRDKRQKFQEALDLQKKKNLEEKQHILDQLRQLIDNENESLKATYDQFNAIQDNWKSIGDVPRENINDLWQNYHFLIEQFFNKVKINKELRDLDLKRNLEQKVALCEKAEELIVEPSIVKAFKALQNLRDQWKEIGPVPSEHNEDIWQRFCNAANQVDQRRKEYYDQRREELDKNLLAKQALVDKASELTENLPTSAKQWNDITDQLDELLKVWKTIGPVQKETNETIWNKFKGSIDNFYNAKKEFFSQVRDQQTENYNRKIDLCLKAEAIAKRDDWKKATEELLQLQSEWKEIGNVSRKLSDKVWLRFRSACDEFFARKNEFFKDIRSNENENLAQKEAIIAQLKDFQFGDDKEQNLNAIKDFQRQWMEIGFVPIKEKDRLQKEFRSVINAHFEKLKISLREAEENAFRERIKRNIGDDQRHFISNERQNLVEQIEKLRNDLSLWENNLGFLANSKQADLLKLEFDKKMQNARQQIALLQAKLRILDESEKIKDQPQKDDEDQNV